MAATNLDHPGMTVNDSCPNNDLSKTVVEENKGKKKSLGTEEED